MGRKFISCYLIVDCFYLTYRFGSEPVHDITICNLSQVKHWTTPTECNSLVIINLFRDVDKLYD